MSGTNRFEQKHKEPVNAVGAGPVSLAMALPSDPLFANQWHLNNTTAGLLDLNLTSVWDSGGVNYTGAGVEVAVIDDGLQYTHHDLDGFYSTVKDWDFADNDGDPSGTSTDDHGTAVAGIIGANRDANGTVGIAYEATLVGFRVTTSGSFPSLLDTFVSQITSAIDNASGQTQTGGVDRTVDLVNISLGSQISGNWFDLLQPTPSLMDDLNTAIDTAAASGRGGLGLIMVKSAGNGRSDGADANASSWNANIHTITVAAVNQNGGVSAYSNPGAANLISGFGSPAAGEVVTTDRLGNAGSSPSDYRFDFNGTSAAAPMVTGVVALMLEANHQLGWRDVQDILSASARHVGSAVGSGPSGNEDYAWAFNGASHWNGGGMHFSRDYGFGLVDAHAAVRMAETWGSSARTTANQASVTEDLTFVDEVDGETIDGTVDGGNTTGTQGTESYTWTETGDIVMEHVEVTITFSSTWIGDIEIFIVSPDGTSSQLLDNIGPDPNGSGTDFGTGGGAPWTFTSNAFRGESSAGTWTLTFTDTQLGDEFIVYDVQFEALGAASGGNDRFVFTEEFSDYAGGAFGHGTVLNGSGSANVLNAAAVTGNTALNLAAGTGTVDGVAITLSSIHEAVTGDGADTITGSATSTLLDAGRGNDRVTGGSGSELILGRGGADLLGASGGNDTVEGGMGNDRIFGSGGADALHGGADNDRVDGGAGVDTMSGGAGDDTLLGGAGNDRGFGGDGADNVNGNDGDDFLRGGTGDDRVSGGAGADEVHGDGGSDNLLGFGGNDTLYGGAGNDLVGGSFGNDSLFGEAGNDNLFGGEANDTIDGGTGADLIFGQAGADLLTGGAGNDRFVFQSVDDSTAGARDTVTDFAAGDRVNLISIDADTGTGGNQAFAFIGSALFTGTAGELRFATNGVDGFVTGDVDGDGGQDFVIHLAGVTAMSAGDFFL